MRYLSIISVLPTVDDGRHALQFGETDRSYRMEAKQCTAVDGAGSKTYFSHLKERLTYHLSVIFIFSALSCRQTALSDGELKPLYPSMLSPKPPDSIEKNCNFTLQNTEVAGLPLPRSVLFKKNFFIVLFKVFN